MSKLRPECRDAGDRAKSLPYDTTLFLIYSSVVRRRSLIFGRLDDDHGGHCAMGCFWDDNPHLSVDNSIVDEVSAVNDSIPASESPKKRWQTVSRWLRWKMRVLANEKANKKVAT